MHRELPNIGNPPRRALELEEKNLLIQTASVSRIREPGDHWERNATILALDFTTGLRIQDILRIKFEHPSYLDLSNGLDLHIQQSEYSDFIIR